MGKLSNKVLEKIKEEKIEPRPRWQFLLKDYIIWSIFILSVVIGGLALCVMSHIFSFNDWDIHQQLQRSRISHIMLSLPYIWIGFLVFFLGLACYNYRHTKHGYCRGTCWIVILSIAGSFALGIIFYLTGAGEIMEDVLLVKFPLYQKIFCCHHQKNIWMQPEKGLLGGKIRDVKSNSEFDLEDFGGFIWVIEKDSQTILRSSVIIIENESVKLIGEKKAERCFHAREVRPWKGRDEE